jgi:hypothetical protein
MRRHNGALRELFSVECGGLSGWQPTGANITVCDSSLLLCTRSARLVEFRATTALTQARRTDGQRAASYDAMRRVAM